MPRIARLALILALVAVVAGGIWLAGPRGSDGPERAAVVEQYADIAHASYRDSLEAARALRARIEAFLESPTPESLADAREAWRAARVPYMQTEAFRFGNPVVDQWEGQVNAWPLDEGLLDYVARGYVHEQGNPAARANLMADPVLEVGGRTVDTQPITPAKLTELNEIGGAEANVATGYHAIEFLLWGQDLNGTDPGAGERPHTDFVRKQGACTDGPDSAPVSHCERRATYLRAATDLLLRDLETMVAEWAPDRDNYRAKLLSLPAEEGIRRMLFGIGSLVLGELAGERMRVALIARSTEDEHDCFSDNTHNPHYYNVVGIANVYRGRYEGGDGDTVAGPALADLVAAADPGLAREVEADLDKALAEMRELKRAADDGERFDQMIAPDNQGGHERIRTAIDALVALAGGIQDAARTLGLGKLKPDDMGHDF